MNIDVEAVRGYRLRTHHLDRKISMDSLLEAAGACGLQNSPPGAWETALYNRLEGCTLGELQKALYVDKRLLQAWSYRGVPAVFPADASGVFLTPLMAEAGEEPWIYTRGITAALDFLGMTFDALLPLVKGAAGHLDSHTITSKELLDRTLADLVERDLPEDKRALWRAPSMYGSPDRQTVGGAAVSFMLRPCAFSHLVVFGERRGVSPTFTSYRRWTGLEPVGLTDGDKRLVRKFLHCYGPATVGDFGDWLGCSPAQSRRLWSTIAEEMVQVMVEGKTRYMLRADMDDLRASDAGGDRLVLLGAHDPYLDMRDRTVILADRSLHRTVWRTVANPGVVLRGGRIVGTWKTKTAKDKLDLSIGLWEGVSSDERKGLRDLAEGYADFRGLALRSCTIEGA